MLEIVLIHRYVLFFEVQLRHPPSNPDEDQSNMHNSIQTAKIISETGREFPHCPLLV